MNITQKEHQHAQGFPSFRVRYLSSYNNIQCFDTTQYCRMTHLFHDYTPPSFSVGQNSIAWILQSFLQNKGKKSSCPWLHHEDIQGKHSYNCTDL